MSSPLRDVFSYVSVGISSIALRRNHSWGLNYGLASLHGEGLQVRPTHWTQSYRRTHLVPKGLVPPLPQWLASREPPLPQQHVISGASSAGRACISGASGADGDYNRSILFDVFF